MTKNSPFVPRGKRRDSSTPPYFTYSACTLLYSAVLRCTPLVLHCIPLVLHPYSGVLESRLFPLDSCSVTSLTTIKINFSENLDMFRKQFEKRFCSPKTRLENVIFSFQKYCLNLQSFSIELHAVTNDVFFLRRVTNASFFMITSSNKNF